MIARLVPPLAGYPQYGRGMEGPRPLGLSVRSVRNRRITGRKIQTVSSLPPRRQGKTGGVQVAPLPIEQLD
jgi:hypothetical protein